MEAVKNKIKDRTTQILEYTKIISNLKKEVSNLEQEHYLLCDHKFEYELITSGPYREYGYVCNNCGYFTKHIV